MNVDVTKLAAWGLARNALAALGGFMVAQGYITEGDVAGLLTSLEGLAAAVAVAVAAVGTIVNKLNAERQIETAAEVGATTGSVTVAKGAARSA